jgi:phosphoglycolate phosphatase-like HAD superfamily hydrolase
VRDPAVAVAVVDIDIDGTLTGVASVMVGDSVWDVEAARRAGMPAIVVRAGGFGDAELQEAGAVAIHDTPGDLLKALGDAPLA